MDAENILSTMFPGIPKDLLRDLIALANGDTQKAARMIAELMEQQESEDEEDAQETRIQNQSIISPHEEYASSCGYCKSDKDTSTSTGMEAVQLTVGDYQALIDCGCRRSGKWLYKPTNNKTCCVQYTIRLPVEKFKLSKNQRKVLNRMHKYLETGIEPKEVHEMEEEQKEVKSNKKQKEGKEEETIKKLEESIYEAMRKAGVEIGIKYEEMTMGESDIVQIKPTAKAQQKFGDFYSNIGPRILGLQKKHKTNIITLSQIELSQLIAKYIVLPSQITKVEVAPNGLINFTLNTMHESPPIKKQKMSANMTAEPAHKLTIETVPATFSKESFELYCKYQTTVHKDDMPTEKGYTRFLVTSPLINEKNTKLPTGSYGSFHQLYRIDGKLIAVGVVDILPYCLSSVYLFYDPDYSFLSLGIFSALKEIEWVQNTMKQVPDLKYYYMGFYIHTCAKMRYKGGYVPSDLLDPEHHVWAPLSECIPKLNVTKYTTFVGGKVATLTPEEEHKIINQIPLLISNKILHLADLTSRGKEIVTPRLKAYLRAIGPQLALKILAHFK